MNILVLPVKGSEGSNAKMRLNVFDRSFSGHKILVLSAEKGAFFDSYSIRVILNTTGFLESEQEILATPGSDSHGKLPPYFSTNRAGIIS